MGDSLCMAWFWPLKLVIMGLHCLASDWLRGQPMGSGLWKLVLALQRSAFDWLRGQPMGESLCPTWFRSLEVGPGLAAVGDVVDHVAGVFA